MKALINTDPIKVFRNIPTLWGNVFNFDKADPQIHYEHGFRDLLLPDGFDESIHILKGPNYTQESLYGAKDDYFIYELCLKSPEELEADRKALIPYSITPTQGRILLSQIKGSVEGESLLHDVIRLLPESATEPISIYWEYSLTWDRDSKFVAQMGASLGLTDSDIDEFFLQAFQINE